MSNELKQIVNDHLAWLKNPEDGLRANLSGANLSDADLSEADLRGANLSRATGILRLPIPEQRQYQWIGSLQKDGWHIFAGCRDFTLTEAREHWLSPDYSGPSCIPHFAKIAIEWLETMDAV